MQSGVGKLSCNKTALKRCTSTETLWNRKAPSLSSPEDEIFLPKLPKSWHADVFKGPTTVIIVVVIFCNARRVNAHCCRRQLGVDRRRIALASRSWSACKCWHRAVHWPRPSVLLCSLRLRRRSNFTVHSVVYC